MQFNKSRKLLVAGILLHCFLLQGMEEAPEPISWQQISLEALRKIVYDTLSKDDQLNYRLRFAQLIENSDLGYDALTSSRIKLAELNAGSSVQAPGTAQRPPSPESSSSSESPTSVSPAEPVLSGPSAIFPEIPSPQSASPMPIANNPLFDQEVESRSPESPLLPQEPTPLKPVLLAEPALPIRPNSAPPCLQPPSIVRPASPAISRASTESSSASRELLMPSAAAHEDNSPLLPPDIQSTARAETPTTTLDFTPTPTLAHDNGPLLSASPALPNDSCLNSTPARSRSSSPMREPINPSAVPSINLSKLTLEELKEIDPEDFTPRTKSEHSRLKTVLEQAKAANDQSNQPQPPAAEPDAENSNKLITTLEVAGIALALWTATEVIVAYKNIPQEEWDNARKWHYKFDLLARKTSNAMASRPGQIKDFITKKFTNR